MVYQSGGNELLDRKKIFERIGLAENMAVADLGCGGSGHFVLFAATIVGEDAPAYAVDIQKPVLDSVAARARLLGLKNVKTVWTDLEKPGATAIPASSVDVALLINTLFWATNHKNMIAEAQRLLKVGGKLLVIDWDHQHVTFGPSPEHKVPVATVEKFAAELGLKKLDQFQAGVYHYGLVYQK